MISSILSIALISTASAASGAIFHTTTGCSKVDGSLCLETCGSFGTFQGYYRDECLKKFSDSKNVFPACNYSPIPITYRTTTNGFLDWKTATHYPNSADACAFFFNCNTPLDGPAAKECKTYLSVTEMKSVELLGLPKSDYCYDNDCFTAPENRAAAAKRFFENTVINGLILMDSNGTQLCGKYSQARLFAEKHGAVTTCYPEAIGTVYIRGVNGYDKRTV